MSDEASKTFRFYSSSAGSLQLCWAYYNQLWAIKPTNLWLGPLNTNIVSSWCLSDMWCFFLFFLTTCFHSLSNPRNKQIKNWSGQATCPRGWQIPANWPLDGSLSGHQTSVGLRLMGHVGQFLPHYSATGCMQSLKVDLISKTHFCSNFGLKLRKQVRHKTSVLFYDLYCKVVL